MTEKQRLQALVVFCVLCILLITLVVPTLIAKVIILFLAFMLIALLSLNAFQDSETDDEPLYIPESWHLPPQSVARRVTRLLTFKEVKLLASIEMQVAEKSSPPQTEALPLRKYRGLFLRVKPELSGRERKILKRIIKRAP